jgi:site-specific DNA recombinase
MKKYIIYCRKSTNDPSHQLYSLPAQEKLCVEYAERNELNVVKIIKEKHSAKDAGKRPLFTQLIEDLKKKKYDGIITHKVDRLLRSIGDYARIDDLRSKGIEFIFVDGSYPNTPDGNMMLGINVVFAKRYVENLSQEVKKGYKEALSQGRFPREAPVGYLDEGRGIKEVDPIYAPLVKEAFELYATGDYSLAALLEVMRNKGLRTKRGQRYKSLISKSSLHRVLKNHFYYGMMQYGGEIHQGRHQPIIEKQVFDKVSHLLESKNTSFKSKKPFAYRGLVRCFKCEGLLSPYDKKGHTYYGCTNKNCAESTVNESSIEKEIAQIIGGFAFTNEELVQARIALENIEKKINGERDEGLESIDQREKAVIKEGDKIRQLLISGSFSDEDYQKEKTRITDELRDIKIQKEAYMEVDQKRYEEVYDFLELSKNAPTYYKHGLLEEKRELVQLIFLELRIHQKKLTSYKLKPEFEVLEKRIVSNGGMDGTRTRDLLRDRQAL